MPDRVEFRTSTEPHLPLADLVSNPSPPGQITREWASSIGVRLGREIGKMVLHLLTLSGIPAKVYEYRLGNRSALDWAIDQYRVKREEKGQIASDPNRTDDEQYIVV